MLDDFAVFLLAALALAALTSLVALVALAVAATSWSVRGLLRRRRAGRGLAALREQHYAEVDRHARRPLVELDAVEFEDWPVLDGDPPVVFPRASRRRS